MSRSLPFCSRERFLSSRSHVRSLTLCFVLASTLGISLGACTSFIPKIVLKHHQKFPDGSEQLEQVLVQGGDTVGTLAKVRSSMVVHDSRTAPRAIMRDGTQLAYTLVVPHAPIDSTKLVVLLHGYDRAQYNWSEAQLRLAALGYPSVAVDLRGTGSSTGEMSFGMTERYDVLELIDQIRRTAHLGDSGVALVGRTFGAGIALQAAALDNGRRIKAVLVEGVFPEFDRMSERLLHSTMRDSLAKRLARSRMSFDSLNPVHALSGIRNLPIAFVWGERDQYVSEQERRVTALFYQPTDPANRQVMVLRGMWHGLDRDPRIISEEDYQAYLGQREFFIKTYLPLGKLTASTH
jgi:pimeloyl-ACP methyl ester carboxylesterase